MQVVFEDGQENTNENWLWHIVHREVKHLRSALSGCVETLNGRYFGMKGNCWQESVLFVDAFQNETKAKKRKNTDLFFLSDICFDEKKVQKIDTKYFFPFPNHDSIGK